MNMYRKLTISVAFCTALSSYSFAIPNIGGKTHKPTHSVMTNGCTQDLGATIFNVNNIKCRIMDEGDMWWNPGTENPYYLAPANSTTNAQFAASLWIGGYDAGNQLKEAAMTYRQNGEDFWAGPIDTCNGSISVTECNNWDKMFYCTEAEVSAYHISYPHGTSTANIPLDILNWPGSGNAAYCESQNLAPYISVSNSGFYNPQQGDYPAFDLTGDGDCQNELYGDACLWWVINDVGNIHTETGSVPIGLEIRCQAFGFKTNDAINNMTFYHYQVVNRSTFTLYHTYFGFWDDFDLGNGADNFTGCDVGRKMGYGYSASAYDPNGTGNYAGEPGYLDDPSAVGVVFFQGPVADPGSTECYVKNGLIGMAHFVYYNNDFSNQGNPTNQTSYYNYLTGFWIDGTPMTYGGNGYQSSNTPCNYMFPYTPAGALGSSSASNTDPTGCGTGGTPQATEWDEISAGDVKGDRRFIESSGPFTLKPGAVNYVIVGCVWDQPGTTGLGNIYPIGLIQQDADLAQGLFANCFKVVNGPDAPDVTAQALNQEIILTLSNSATSNNYDEHYKEKDATIPVDTALHIKDSDYVFEGYEIFQLIDSSVTSSELLDPTKARLVAQCDVKDSVGQIVNYIFNSSLNANIPTLEVSGSNKGIVHSFDIKSDAFQQDNEANLVNDRPYYFMAIAYGFNNYYPYKPNGPINNLTYGQKLPFLQGRRNIKCYSVIPTVVTSENGGTVLNSVYGSGVPITRLEGHGNGGNVIELDQNSINYILQNDTMAHPSYLAGQGPITVKIVDPLNVVGANFIVKFIPDATGVTSSTKWELINQNTGEVDLSDTTIGYQYEQVFPQYGISITLTNVPYADGNNKGVVDSSSTLTFANPNQNWLSYVSSAAPGVNLAYWIRSGAVAAPSPPTDPGQDFPSYGKTGNYDPNQYYNQIINGSWAPYSLCAVSDKNEYCDNGPAFSTISSPQYNGLVADSIGNAASVDIVFTSNRANWTRCIVLEEQDQPTLAQGGAAKLDPRMSLSIDQDGQYVDATLPPAEFTDPSLANYISDTAMGWFPGYAINLETGERLNMAYGEDSWLSGDNGRDMKWDPDSIVYSGGGSTGAGGYFGVTSIFGGKHYIYVFGHNTNKASVTKNASIPAYDAGLTIHSLFFHEVLPNGNTALGNDWHAYIMNDVMWVNIPLLTPGHQLLECDATVKLRMQTPYDTAYGETFLNDGVSQNVHVGSSWRNPNPSNKNFPEYSFNTNGLGVVINDASAASSALSLINIVPNPYYAYSGYESTALDTRVRITNLPPVCTISIFTLSGTLITVIQKNNPQTYTDWTLMNQYNVPIASGLYLVHVAVPNVGEVTLKWFGVMRPLDLTSY
jgi:hypothetical protein